ncbi:MAG: hypothetical protein L6R42_006720 [Xanthoria sp. 1 TBL-2021]|nr:MAG: hypothetical protein L6R42_006720 [Xanthoria sp. 1 TBL-2021]
MHWLRGLPQLNYAHVISAERSAVSLALAQALPHSVFSHRETVEHSQIPLGCDRKKFITTTVKNDLATLMEIYAAYKGGAKVMRKVRQMTWTQVLQPLLPAMAKKGQPNVLGSQLYGKTLQTTG